MIFTGGLEPAGGLEGGVNGGGDGNAWPDAWPDAWLVTVRGGMVWVILSRLAKRSGMAAMVALVVPGALAAVPSVPGDAHPLAFAFDRLAKSVRESGPCRAAKGMAIRSPAEGGLPDNTEVLGLAIAEVPAGGETTVAGAGLTPPGSGLPTAGAGAPEAGGAHKGAAPPEAGTPPGAE